MSPHSAPALATLILTLLVAGAAPGAPADVPETISYQGVLLDDQGNPRTGNVDLTVRIYDDTTPFAELIYKEEFTSVPLDAGVFAIAIGPMGVATDTPTDPLTTSLADTFTAEFPSAGGERFLELTVGTEGALGRIQILSSPFAIHARSADTADTATTALSADSADTVDGLDASFVTELFEHGNSDGGGPANSSPKEGLGDTDGDGIANFVDPDNDDDGLSDDQETGVSDINLVTPTVTSFGPPTAQSHVTTQVTVQGTNFDPGLSVTFGTETPTPTNVTPTSFEVLVGPQPVGTASVAVLLPNGESGNNTFDFFLLVPSISSFDPVMAFSVFTTNVTVNGQNFEPGLTVAFGSENPSPQSVTSTSFDVDVGPQPPGTVAVDVTLTNGEMASSSFDFTNAMPHTVVLGANHATLDVFGTDQTALGGLDHYGVATLGVGTPETIFPYVGAGINPSSQLAVAWDATGDLGGLRCEGSAGLCDVEFARDADADLTFEPGETTTVETISGFSTRVWSPRLVFDGSDRPVAGYVRRVNANTHSAIVLRDTSGDDAFGGAGEFTVVESLDGGFPTAGGLALDASGNVAYAYGAELSGVDQVRVAYDRSGDGDFDDAPGGNPELFTAASLAGDPTCVGAAFDPTGRLAVIYGGGSDTVTLLRDLEGDGDFDGVGESLTLGTSAAEGCDVSSSTSGALTAAFRDGAGSLVLAIDRDDNGDFGGVNELQTLNSVGASSDRVAVTLSDTDLAVVATEGSILVDPNP